MQECTRAQPLGLRCTRKAGHDGPCAAVRIVELGDLHFAAPAALGENVLRYAPPGAVSLTVPQRHGVLATLDRLRKKMFELQEQLVSEREQRRKDLNALADKGWSLWP